MTDYKYYVDASFEGKNSLGVLGYIVVSSDSKEYSISLSSALSEKNNIRMELRANIEVLKEIIEIRKSLSNANDISSFEVYTDCQTVSKLIERREKLFSKDFKSGRTGKDLNNADLYREFFKLQDIAKAKIIWIKGHTKKSERSENAHFFSLIDQAVRSKLRDIS